MVNHIDFCNSVEFLNGKTDPERGKGGRGVNEKIKKLKPKFNKNNIRISLYRTFFKQYLYFDVTRTFNGEIYQMPKLFPNEDSKNIVILIPINFHGEFIPFITNITPDNHTIYTNQCFPLYTYENNIKKENIRDSTLQEYQIHYSNKKITKQDIFYYIYGLLHHLKYHVKFENNLTKDLPHIPMAPNFRIFKDIGERLAKLHLNFDTCKRYRLGEPKNKFDQVKVMRYKNKNFDPDKTTLQINGIDVFDNIPKINYMVGGKTPLEWIFDRYKLHQYKENKLENNPCKDIDIIPIIERAIYVGVESDKLIQDLLKEFEPKNWTPKKIELDEHIWSV